MEILGIRVRGSDWWKGVDLKEISGGEWRENFGMSRLENVCHQDETVTVMAEVLCDAKLLQNLNFPNALFTSNAHNISISPVAQLEKATFSKEPHLEKTTGMCCLRDL